MIFSKNMLITKLKATAVHLALSSVVFAYLAYLIIYEWYPEPFFSIDGGWQGLRLVASVDLVLGPLITFLVFDLTKSRRDFFFDMAVIIILQFSALGYGVYTTFAQKPVAIVLIDEYMLPATWEYYGGELESEAQLKQYSDEHPPIIFANMPMDREIVDEVIRIKSEKGILEIAQTQLYQSKSGLKVALQARQTLFINRLVSNEEVELLNVWLKLNQKSRDDILIARFSGRFGSVWLVFDQDAKYIGYF